MKISKEAEKYINHGSRRPTSIKVSLPTTIVVTYEDGAVRQMDMKKEMYGVMASLKDESVFKTVHIKGNSGIVWNAPAGEIDIDTDSIYIYGKAIEKEDSSVKIYNQ